MTVNQLVNRPRALILARADAQEQSVWKWLAAFLAAASLILAAGFAQAREAPESFADLVEKLLPAVVNISTTQTLKETRGGPEIPQFPPGSPFEEFFKDFMERQGPGNRPQQRSRKATSLGSGFIIDPSGYVVTNNHVIADADEINVILNDNTVIKAEIVGRDVKTDLALLKVANGKPLPSVKFGNSDEHRVGDWVLAIGNPFGLGGTVTAGIISAKARDINSGPYDDFIQTDASINRGNSGGPMFNLKGEVIGINTAIYSPTGASVGIGFAVPSAMAKAVVEDLKKFGKTRRGWLGVHIQTVTEEIAENLGLKDAKGALVASISEGGPAARSGIKAGDVVLKFDNKEVTEMKRLPRIVAETPIGKDVNVELWRDGKRLNVKVAIGELPEEEVAEAKPSKQKGGEPSAAAKSLAALGLSLAPITPEARERFELAEAAKGVLITEVDPEGPAAEKGLRPGDVIVEVGQKEVANPADVASRVEDAKKQGRKTVLLLVETKRGMNFVPLTLAQKEAGKEKKGKK